MERQESAYSLSGTPCCCGAADSELLLCAVACVQFCFYAFQSYAQLTSIELLLGVQVRNLRHHEQALRGRFESQLQRSRLDEDMADVDLAAPDSPPVLLPDANPTAP